MRAAVWLTRIVERRRGNLVLSKLRELWWSRQLTRHLTKRQIWCGYLWRAYFGAHMTGYAAARAFLAPGVITPSLEQAASIAACLKYPRPKNPTTRWERRHKQRIIYILRRMELVKNELSATIIS
jgi:membrane carboxypeptidase/penicillin-binding protein